MPKTWAAQPAAHPTCVTAVLWQVSPCPRSLVAQWDEPWTSAVTVVVWNPRGIIRVGELICSLCGCPDRDLVCAANVLHRDPQPVVIAAWTCAVNIRDTSSASSSIHRVLVPWPLTPDSYTKVQVLTSAAESTGVRAGGEDCGVCYCGIVTSLVSSPCVKVECTTTHRQQANHPTHIAIVEDFCTGSKFTRVVERIVEFVSIEVLRQTVNFWGIPAKQ